MVLALALGCGGGSSAGNTKGGGSQGNVTPSDLTAGIFSVSGTVTYAGTRTGPIYVLLLETDGGGACLGTTLAQPGAFTIRGVPSGTYSLTASLDAVGNGTPNLNDPATTTSLPVTVDGQSLAGEDLVLVDPGLNLHGQAGPPFTASPMDSGILLAFDPITETSATTGLTADCALSYTVAWSAFPDFRTLAGTASFAAQASQGGIACLQDPTLVNGAAFYFRMNAVAPGSSSLWSVSGGPVTVGAPTGGRTVTGTLNFSSQAKGPLYVLCQDEEGDLYGCRIASPASPQSFAIPGVPDGTYTLSAFLDQNNNGLLDAGDSNDFPAWAPPFQVDASLGPQSLSLPSGNAFTVATTYHYQTAGAQDDFLEELYVQDLGLHVTGSTVLSGPAGTIAPQDLGNTGEGFTALTDLGSTRPLSTDAFSCLVTYADGSQETLTTGITGFLADLPQDPQPDGTAGVGLTPVFTWRPPASAPTTFWYNVYVWCESSGVAWDTGWLPSTQTSLTYGTDPTDASNTAPALTRGTTCQWMLTIADANGNMGMNTLTFTP
jgi:uncharacterized protein (DUF2141 family)